MWKTVIIDDLPKNNRCLPRFYPAAILGLPAVLCNCPDIVGRFSGVFHVHRTLKKRGPVTENLSNQSGSIATRPLPKAIISKRPNQRAESPVAILVTDGLRPTAVTRFLNGSTAGTRVEQPFRTIAHRQILGHYGQSEIVSGEAGGNVTNSGCLMAGLPEGLLSVELTGSDH